MLKPTETHWQPSAVATRATVPATDCEAATTRNVTATESLSSLSSGSGPGAPGKRCSSLPCRGQCRLPCGSAAWQFELYGGNGGNAELETSD